MNKVTKLQNGIWKILAKQVFTTFAEPVRGFIHIPTPERGCITPEKLGNLQKTMRFLFTNKQKIKKKVLFTLESDAIARHHNTQFKSIKMIHKHKHLVV